MLRILTDLIVGNTEGDTAEEETIQRINQSLEKSLQKNRGEWKDAYESYKQEEREHFLNTVEGIQRDVIQDIVGEIKRINEEEREKALQGLEDRLAEFRQQISTKADREELDEVEDRVTEVETRVDTTSREIGNLKEEIKDIRNTGENRRQAIQRLEEVAEELEEQVEEHRAQLERKIAKKIGAEKLEEMRNEFDSRLNRLETNSADNERLKNLEGELDEISRHVGELHSRTETHEERTRKAERAREELQEIREKVEQEPGEDHRLEQKIVRLMKRIDELEREHSKTQQTVERMKDNADRRSEVRMDSSGNLSQDETRASNSLSPSQIDRSRIGEELTINGQLSFHKQFTDSYLYTLSDQGAHLLVYSDDELSEGERSLTGRLKKMEDRLYLRV